jgi:hypothetical protein
MKNRRWFVIALITLHSSLFTGLVGCESLQKKFTRKPKTPVERPQPVVSFRNYMEGATPMDRYRKHYAMFAYWNDQLITELQQPRDMNPKRVQRASEETLQELRILSELLREDAAAELQPMIEERARLDQHLQGSMTGGTQLRNTARTLETQTRQITRRFDWRRVQDRLKPVEDARAD